MHTSTRPSIVEYFGEHNGSTCGYCKSTNKYNTYGMWAHRMTVKDYQGLIDRGWRRSGCYCYKPVTGKACCPLYTIRCAALEFNISKSQKKTIKKLNRYLMTDEKNETSVENIKAAETGVIVDRNPVKEQCTIHLEAKGNVCSSVAFNSLKLEETESNINACDSTGKEETPFNSIPANKEEHLTHKREDESLTPSRQNKAKLLRKERKCMKLLKRGLTEEEVNAKLKSEKQQDKSLEEFLNESMPSDTIHNLNIQLVRSSPPSKEFEQAFEESYQLYKKYETVVHNSPPDECTARQYKRFLVDSPLQALDGYGSFQQQYWLDGKLIAVGVIDILPNCISSVYFFYNPDFAFLSLGTYGSLREIAMVRSLHQHTPSIEFYYMGYYIDSCPKMRYKANYKPSYLLCPEVYTWHPFSECKQKFEEEKYCRLNPNVAAVDNEANVNIDEVLVLFKHMVILYGQYKKFVGHKQNIEDEEILQYAKVVGQDKSKSMLLYRADN